MRPPLNFDFEPGQDPDPNIILDLEREPGFDPADIFTKLNELTEAKRARDEETAQRKRERENQQAISDQNAETPKRRHDDDQKSTGDERQTTTTQPNTVE